MDGKHFKTAQEMSDYQDERELQEALRVQQMNGDELFEWLEQNWAPLQRQANALYAGMPLLPPSGRHFETMEEKNLFDEQREIDFALDFSMRGG
jgi:hypothetical protein